MLHHSSSSWREYIGQNDLIQQTVRRLYLTCCMNCWLLGLPSAFIQS